MNEFVYNILVMLANNTLPLILTGVALYHYKKLKCKEAIAIFGLFVIWLTWMILEIKQIDEKNLTISDVVYISSFISTLSLLSFSLVITVSLLFCRKQKLSTSCPPNR